MEIFLVISGYNKLYKGKFVLFFVRDGRVNYYYVSHSRLWNRGRFALRVGIFLMN